MTAFTISNFSNDEMSLSELDQLAGGLTKEQVAAIAFTVALAPMAAAVAAGAAGTAYVVTHPLWDVFY